MTFRTHSKPIDTSSVHRQNRGDELCGLAIGLSGDGMIIGLVAGIIGAVAGTLEELRRGAF
jgi:uncharacterized membrane protein